MVTTTDFRCYILDWYHAGQECRAVFLPGEWPPGRARAAARMALVHDRSDPWYPPPRKRDLHILLHSWWRRRPTLPNEMSEYAWVLAEASAPGPGVQRGVVVAVHS